MRLRHFHTEYLPTAMSAIALKRCPTDGVAHASPELTIYIRHWRTEVTSPRNGSRMIRRLKMNLPSTEGQSLPGRLSGKVSFVSDRVWLQAVHTDCRSFSC
ncbi:hypothetical protein LIA77_11199 [Sarocladium implicatum]|nr:hypothetical protein LIA77_11199 [Sarocladium implicatum]